MAGDAPGTAPDAPEDTAPESAGPDSAPSEGAASGSGARRRTGPGNPVLPGAPAAPLALYRKYRPATFAEVKGQEHVTQPLQQALRSGRIHHAYLFSGPRGCGKTSSARILARSLNCEQGPTPEPCGTCASCVALAPTGPGSIDVIEIDAASHGGVDDARDLRERAFYAPVAGRFKIYIIDEAHMVTREGFNALLKLVEEPPPHLKFVFATTEPEKVIATIRSRTHHYPFRLMPPAVLRELLEEILAAEGIACEPAVLPLVVRAGAGSARDSLSVLDQLLAGAGEEGLTYERTVALLGYTDDSLLDEMVGAFASGDGAAVFGTLDRVMEAGHDPRRFAADLLDRLRDLIILAALPHAADSGLLDAPADRLERMTAQAGRFGQAELARAASLLNEGLVQMRGAASPRLLLELSCAQVLLPGAHADEKALLARLERLERRLEGAAPTAAAPAPTAPAPTAAAPSAPAPARPPARERRGAAERPTAAPAPAPDAERLPAGMAGPGAGANRAPSRPPGREAETGHSTGAAAGRSRAASGPAASGPVPVRPAASGSVDAAGLRERWPDLMDAVNAERKVARILLQSAAVASVENGVVTLAFAKEGEARAFSSSDHAQVVERVLSAHLGRQARVRAVFDPGAASAAALAGRAREQRAPAAAQQPAGGDAVPANEDAASPPTRPSSPAAGSAGTRGRNAPSRSAREPAPRRSAPDPGPVSPGPASSGPPNSGPAGSGPSDPPASAFDENEWPDDAGVAAGEGGAGLSGMDLIRHQLGGEIIGEFDEG